jgi:hypothetical protein
MLLKKRRGKTRIHSEFDGSLLKGIGHCKNECPVSRRDTTAVIHETAFHPEPMKKQPRILRRYALQDDSAVVAARGYFRADPKTCAPDFDCRV